MYYRFPVPKGCGSKGDVWAADKEYSWGGGVVNIEKQSGVIVLTVGQS